MRLSAGSASSSNTIDKSQVKLQSNASSFLRTLKRFMGKDSMTLVVAILTVCSGLWHSMV